MIEWKKLGKKMLFPPLWVIIVMTIATAVAVPLLFVNGLEMHPLAYVIYVISFYAVVILCAFLVLVIPKKYRDIKQKVYDNELGSRYMTDPVFRNNISLYISFGVNVLYVGINALSGYWYHTKWFYILAGYYGILAVMRFLLLKYVNHNVIGDNWISEWKRARACAYILTLVNFMLSGVVLMMMYQNRGFEYHGILIYVMATYTFYITTAAIVRIVKYRKYKSPVMSMAKIITLAAALVSMLSLETAMLSQFGAETTEQTKRILIAATGGGISVVVIIMSCYMIVRATKEIKRAGEVK